MYLGLINTRGNEVRAQDYSRLNIDNEPFTMVRHGDDIGFTNKNPIRFEFKSDWGEVLFFGIFYENFSPFCYGRSTVNLAGSPERMSAGHYIEYEPGALFFRIGKDPREVFKEKEESVEKKRVSWWRRLIEAFR